MNAPASDLNTIIYDAFETLAPSKVVKIKEVDAKVSKNVSDLIRRKKEMIDNKNLRDPNELKSKINSISSKS